LCFFFYPEGRGGGGGGSYRIEDLHPQGKPVAPSVIRSAITETHRTFACEQIVLESDTEISQESALQSICGHVELIKIYIVKIMERSR